MNINEFKELCKIQLTKRGYKKHKNMYYLLGETGLLSGIYLQRSAYNSSYYIRCYFFVGDFGDINVSSYPTYNDFDITTTMGILSKTQTKNGKFIKIGAIEYEHYSTQEIENYFNDLYSQILFPPLYQDLKCIINNPKLYSICPINETDILEKLSLYN